MQSLAHAIDHRQISDGIDQLAPMRVLWRLTLWNFTDG
jgi:hypothetical protein